MEADGGDSNEYGDRPWTEEAILRDLYEQKGLTGEEIGDILGCTFQTVYKWLKRHDIDVDRTGPKSNTDPLRNAEWLREKYHVDGCSQQDIADELGCDRWSVGLWLQRHEIPRRGSHGRTPFDETVADEKWLREQYVERERWPYQIADQVGCAASTVARWCRIHNLPRHDGYPSGEDCPAYVDGKSDDRGYGAKWQAVRSEALERDGYKCQRCSMEQAEHVEQFGRGLEGHHIRPARTFDALIDAHYIENVVTLCRPCHKKLEGLPIDNGTT